MKDVLNLTYYGGEDLYSDGQVEDELLKAVRENDDYDEFLKQNNEWAFLYHLSPIRENLLEWYDFKPEGSLLEIGSGCGALTGLFSRKLSRVVGIDLSKKRSEINMYKNSAYDNFEIYVGNFKDITIDEKFDYVTLIGVLEYSCYYVGGDDPFVTMLKKAASYLKPNGTLIIAIENRLGMKYFAGAPEDHTGNMFDGITGYNNVDRVRTFSKPALKRLLSSAGFNNQKFYYPIPDYKMPKEVFSQDRLPTAGQLAGTSVAFDRSRYAMFSEDDAFNEVCKDGLFELFANSFLVFCS